MTRRMSAAAVVVGVLVGVLFMITVGAALGANTAAFIALGAGLLYVLATEFVALRRYRRRR